MDTQTAAESQAGVGVRDEWAAAKLWSVYISEAEKYDKTLVEGWKSDMDGLLIFAGLFSASLTAFIVESYKTLSPDQGAVTIALLAQISRQLEPQSNGSSTPAIATSLPFSPSASSLACNVLWFLSLGLSLSCALIATLVEQWSRDFIQRADMRPSPMVRARIFSYLYLGIRRFGMHTMVEFIPLLLHLSLLFFFAGLVAFLYPVNVVLMLVAALPTTLICVTYITLTVLPIFFSDSPYRTPLSNVVWTLLVSLPRIRGPLVDKEKGTPDAALREARKDTLTMVEVMARDATQESGDRNKRDNRAIVWTLRSLSDYEELEPFVEALPDLVLGATQIRTKNNMLNMLLDTPDIRLISRIEDLLHSCDIGLLSASAMGRRRMTCIKALWAITDFVAQDASSRKSFPEFNLRLVAAQLGSPTATSEDKSYLTSTYTLIRWIRMWSLLVAIRDIEFKMNTAAAGTTNDVWALLGSVQHRADNLGFHRLSKTIPTDIPTDAAVHIPGLIRSSREALSLEAIDIFTEYLTNAIGIDEAPKAFETVCNLLQGINTSPFAQRALKDTFAKIIHHKGWAFLENHKGFHHIDVIAGFALPHINEQDTEVAMLNASFTKAVVKYLCFRLWKPFVCQRVVTLCNPPLLGSLLKDFLSRGPGMQTNGTLYTIFTLCARSTPDNLLVFFEEDILSVISAAPIFPVSACAIAAAKAHILMRSKKLPPDELDLLLTRLKIPEVVNGTGSGPDERLNTAFSLILVEFIEQHCYPMSLDEWNIGNIGTTVHCLIRYCSPDSSLFNLELQCRLAKSIEKMVCNTPLPAVHRTIIDAILHWANWSSNGLRLDNLNACATLSEALAVYARTVPSDQSIAMGRINRFRAALDSCSRTPELGPTPSTLHADSTPPASSKTSRHESIGESVDG
ncbi:hypothetical protein C8R47DRAFT_1224082 [Mycena vitilis]|nr:hypothetical protein C8R47DRAFT_1224082 [Mycena vitilis]